MFTPLTINTTKNEYLQTKKHAKITGGFKSQGVIMSAEAKSKGTWFHRFAIQAFTILLAILIYWLLGFLVEDIESIPGPDYKTIEKHYISQELLDNQKDLDKQISDFSHQIDNQTEKQRNVADSSRNLQQTMNQLLELQKIGVEKGIHLSDTEQANLGTTLNLFLENQKSYQEINQTISGLLEKKQQLVGEQEQAQRKIADQRKPALEEYEKLQDQHMLNLALYQLAILLPILLVAILLAIKMRSSIYFPLFLAFAAAAAIKVAFVVHDYFPSRYFKYIFILGLLLAVSMLLIRFIRAIAYPKPQWLAKQYREGYERFLCPVCEYPIRTGPRRFLFWTRRTVNKLVVPSENETQEEAYSCPACGTGLFEVCTACRKIRHSLLPHCSHCGSENSAIQSELN